MRALWPRWQRRSKPKLRNRTHISVTDRWLYPYSI
ncbi:protein of unknown function [Burkholderia multivorans]